MCMSCNATNKITKKKIAVFSTIAIGIALATYFILAMTNNLAIVASAAIIPSILSFAICPLMCVPMIGIMWFINRTQKNKENKASIVDTNQKEQDDTRT